MRSLPGWGVGRREVDGEAVSSLGLALKNRALLALMLGHFTNDMFAGVLPVLFPTVKERFDLTNAGVGLITLAYTAMASLTQPLFGYLVDRHVRRWYASATLLWGAACVAGYGFAPSYPTLLLLAALAGVASGAYHPLGAANAAAVTDDRYRNAAMSLYTVGGTSGFAVGPLVGVALLALFGSHGTIALVVPGLVVAALLLPQMRLIERMRRVRVAARTDPDAGGRPAWGALGRVVAVTMLRSWVFLSVLQFVPIWYDDLGFGAGFYGALATTIILAGVIGTLAGGLLADRLGQRRIVVASLALAVPALLLFAGVPGRYALLTGALFGIASDASLSITLVMAQRLVPGRVGVVSGIILGLGFVTGGIGVPITGRLADAVGIQAALMSLGVLCALASLLALTIPSELASGDRPAPSGEARTQARESVAAASAATAARE